MMSVEETGLQYYLILPDRRQIIGVKRYGGYFCYRCNASLLVDGEDSGRKSIKSFCESCPLCNQSPKTSPEIVSSSSFDWIMGPHLIPRLFVLPKTSGVDSVENNNNKTRHQNNLTYVVEDQYGNQCTVDQFWKRVADSCPIQFYNRIQQ